MNRYEIVRPMTTIAVVYASHREAAIRALQVVNDEFEGQVTVLDETASAVERLGGVATITIELSPATTADITREESL